MSLREFDDAAGGAGEAMRAADRHDAIALACRGSGTPATLAWLAEALGLAAGDAVLDIGGGLGGPSAWLAEHHRCRAVCVDPVRSSLVAAHAVLPLPAVVCTGAALPFPADAFDAALLLGVVSVVPDAIRHHAIEAVVLTCSRAGGGA